jgi:hypothetical protein
MRRYGKGGYSSAGCGRGRALKSCNATHDNAPLLECWVVYLTEEEARSMPDMIIMLNHRVAVYRNPSAPPSVKFFDKDRASLLHAGGE